MKKVFPWKPGKNGLVPDESHAVGGFDEVAEGLPLFITNVVMEADFVKEQSAGAISGEFILPGTGTVSGN